MTDIIGMQQPDPDGNTIPPGTLHGTAVLSAASADPQWINIGVSIGIFNVSTATCNGHCPYCTDFIDFRVQADIGTAPVGQDTEFSSWAESSDYTWIDYTLQSQWTSSNIQVAQPSCCTVGAFTGVSTGSFTANASATLEGGNYDCPEDCNPTYYYKGATGTVTTPSATLNVHLGPGSKTPGDNLSFLDSSTTCSESLGLTNCYATTAWWLWDIEVAGSVSDDASKWTVSQTVVGLSKGYYVDTNGNLQPFTENVPQQDDTPSSTFIQQPTGQTLVFWIDAPGRYFKYSGFRVDSATTAYNFTSTITSKAYPSVSVSFAWYVKIIVNSGAQLDTSNSSAGPGSTSLNF